MSVILLNERIVHYEVLGRGRPVIFLHSWIGSWRYWIPAMQTAAMSFRAYALDLYGFGDTSHEATLYPLDKQVELIDNFLQEMGIGKAAFIGHGLGALAAVLFARRWPQFVARIMTINMPFEISNVAARLRSPASPVDLADWLVSKEAIGEPARTDANKSDPSAITISIGNLVNLNMLGILRAMTTPTLIVHGQNDPAIEAPPNDYLPVLPDHLHQIVLEEAGHFPMLDISPKFNRLMTDFLGLFSGENPGQLQLKEEWKRRMR